MYGMHIHEAVVKNKESKTGITIHYVNEAYDEGAIIFQEEVALSRISIFVKANRIFDRTILTPLKR